MTALLVWVGGVFLALLAVAAVGGVVVWWSVLGENARHLRREIEWARATEARFERVKKLVQKTNRMRCDPRCSYQRWRRSATEEQLFAKLAPDCDCGGWLLSNLLDGYGGTKFTVAEDIEYDSRPWLPGELPAGFYPDEDDADEDDAERHAEGGPS